MNNYERAYTLLVEDNLEEGKVKDFLRNAALVGIAAGAGRMGAMTATDSGASTPAKRPGVTLNIKKTPRKSQVDTFAHLNANERRAKPKNPTKPDKSLLARIKSIKPKDNKPFSSGYQTTSSPEGQVSADIADKVTKHKELNATNRGQKSARKNILTRWKKNKPGGSI